MLDGGLRRDDFVATPVGEEENDDVFVAPRVLYVSSLPSGRITSLSKGEELQLSFKKFGPQPRNFFGFCTE